MSWVDSEGLERGGDCNECGEPVEEEHHAYCARCFAEQNGWSPPDRDELRRQAEDRERMTILRIVERLGQLERRVTELERYQLRGTVAA